MKIKYSLLIMAMIFSNCSNKLISQEFDASLEIVYPPSHNKLQDRLTINYKNSVAIVEVESPSGIGAAMIRKKSTNSWPNKMVIHLYLSALEGFQAEADHDYTKRFSYRLTREENAFHEGNKSEPIEVKIPDEMLKRAKNTITIHWVNRYR